MKKTSDPVFFVFCGPQTFLPKCFGGNFIFMTPAKAFYLQKQSLLIACRNNFRTWNAVQSQKLTTAIDFDSSQVIIEHRAQTYFLDYVDHGLNRNFSTCWKFSNFILIEHVSGIVFMKSWEGQKEQRILSLLTFYTQICSWLMTIFFIS